MKTLLFFSIILFSAHSSVAQDVICTTDGDSIIAKIQLIDKEEIRYKKYSNLDGPDYGVSRSMVSVIVYENGSKDRFNETFQLPPGSDEMEIRSTSKDSVVEELEIFTVVEQMPEYPGGQDEMMIFLGENIKYPDAAKDAGIQGTVYVKFILYEDGSIKDVKVMRGIGGGCDEEAIRVVKMMPNWKPGRQRGENVRVSFILPIRFTLSNPNKNQKKRRG
ncbi:MAG: energy transducer TonB [Flavobacteriales bacterium]|nr:energy transducer TonB [Flavobacteriales bacterium]